MLHFGFILKKKKKAKWVTEEQIPPGSLQKEAPALLGVRRLYWILLFSSARAASGWSPLAGHYRSEHRDSARPTQGIPEQERKSPCFSWRYSLCPECWEKTLARSICEHVPFHVAWHGLIPSSEKKDPWETYQVSALLCDPTALQCEGCPLRGTQCGATDSSLSPPPAILPAANSSTFLP